MIDGKTYYIKSLDGKFAVLDKTKLLAFMRDVPMASASKFTAVKKSCNLYGLCVEGMCMSRCDSCKSDTGDVQTVRFHAKNSDNAYSQWTVEDAAVGGIGGPYTFKTDGGNGYLTSKKTPNNDFQLTLSKAILPKDSIFELVEAP